MTWKVAGEFIWLNGLFSAEQWGVPKKVKWKSPGSDLPDV